MSSEGELLREIRKEAGMAQWEMALYLRVSRSLVSLIEIGRRNLPSGKMLKLLDLMRELKESRAVNPYTADAQHVADPEENSYNQELLKREIDYFDYRVSFLRLEIKRMEKRYRLNLAKRNRYLRERKKRDPDNKGWQQLPASAYPGQSKEAGAIPIPPRIFFILRDTSPAARELKQLEIDSLLQRKEKAASMLLKLG